MATCVKVTRVVDGVVIGFTDHDVDLLVNGVLYRSVLGIDVSAVETNEGLNVANLEMRGLLTAAGMTEAQIVAGVWDHADIRVFAVNWNALTAGTVKLRRGWLGEVSVTQDFRAELRGLAQKLQQTIGRLVKETCDADLFDTRCQVAETEGVFKFSNESVGSVVLAQRSFVLAPGSPVTVYGLAADFLTNGKVLWTSGDNGGLSKEIKSHSLGSPGGDGPVITLTEAMPYLILPGDQLTLWAGCRKRELEDCVAKFNNQVNFRGFRFVPGTDATLKGAS